MFSKIRIILNKWPGESKFGIYRFLPAFFFLGVAIEFAMINWRPNGVNFYEIYKQKKSREKALQKFEILQELEKYQ